MDSGILFCLLLLLGVSPLVQHNFRLRTILLCAEAGLLGWLSLSVFQGETPNFAGWNLFEFSARLHLQLSLRLTSLVLPILWFCWWWRASRPVANFNLAVSCGMALVLLGDDFLLLGIGLASVVWGLRPKRETTFAERGEFALGWLSLIPFSLCVGSLLFDLQLESFSAAEVWIRETDEFSRLEQSALTLLGLNLGFCVIFLAALFPWHIFWIEGSKDETNLAGVRLLLAAGLLIKFQPLLIDSTLQLTRELALIGFLICAVCSIARSFAGDRGRTIVFAHTALGLTGLIGDTAAIVLAGLLQLLVAQLLLVAYRRHDRFGQLLALAAMVSGLSGSGYLLQKLFSGSPVLEWLSLAAWMVLVFAQTRTLFAAGEDAGQNFVRSAAIPILVCEAALLCDQILSNSLGTLRHLLFCVLGTSAVLAMLVSRRYTQSKPLTSPALISVRTLLDRQGYLLEFWESAVSVPGQFLELLLNIPAWIVAQFKRYSTPAEEESPAWELARGTVCLVVLLVLFLWWEG